MGKNVANGLLLAGLIIYIVAFFLPFGIQPKGPAYMFMNAFSVLNFPDQPHLRILGGIFIWVPSITVLMIFFSRFFKMSKWLIIPFILLTLIEIMLITYDSQSGNMIMGLPHQMGAAYWTWVVAVLMIFLSQLLYKRGV